MNFVQVARSVGRAARKAARSRRDMMLKAGQDTTLTQDEVDKMAAEIYKQEYRLAYIREELELREDLTMAFREGGIRDILAEFGFEVNKPSTKIAGKWFFITLRPSNEHEHRFVDFKPMVFKYLERTMFINWMLAFEQKGKNNDEIGKGYHVHIIAECAKWCTKKKMINDTKRTWDKWLNGNVPDAFVQIDKIETEQEKKIKELYITGHKSDQHKQEAIATDIIWRSNVGLQPTYCSPAYQVQERGSG